MLKIKKLAEKCMKLNRFDKNLWQFAKLDPYEIVKISSFAKINPRKKQFFQPRVIKISPKLIPLR